ncbi:MAG TPA: HNH endonuclease, partial [Polyangiaceae bacterium]|nr:HNH endonuclease [Polyangiaceae bacterium]
GRTVRDVEQLVSGHRPGSLPDDVPDSRLKRHTLRLELSGEVVATYREAMAKIRRDAGEPLNEDAAFLLLCRQALDGNREPGRSSYQIALTVCERCRRATQQGRGECIEVGPEILEMAECDAQHVGHVDDHVGVQHDAGGHAHVHVDDNAGGHADVHVDDHAGGRAHVDAHPRRATPTIAPATRRTVLLRDGGKCRVPGCRHAVFTEPHHLERRSEGGQHLIDNLVTLCGAHHRAAHSGSLVISGTPSSGLSFTHADGTPYGGAVAPAVADTRAKAFQALVGMGFRENEAKRALARLPQSVASLEQVIRQALRELAPQ